MKVVLILAVVAACARAHSVSTEATQLRTPSPEDRGFIEWVSNLLGGGTTSRPVDDTPVSPPKNCPTCKCGLARTRRRIVGGTETKVLEYPWMAELLYRGRFYCAGSVFTNLHVLTAAHCTSGMRKEYITVRLLDHDRSTTNETKTVESKLAKIIIHPGYDSHRTYDNDIAILKLSAPLDISSALKRVRKDGDNQTESEEEEEEEEEKEDLGLRPVCLPSPGESYKHYEATVAGWGTTMESGSPSETLQKVSVSILSNDECRKTAIKHSITDNMLCAGPLEGGRDACQGDSGGPLQVANTTNGQYQEVGIVSWGEGCARPNKPGVYTRVNRYLTWIKSNTRDGCYCQ